MSTESFVFHREAFLDKCVADHEAGLATEQAEDRAILNRINAMRSTGPRTPAARRLPAKTVSRTASAPPR